MSNAIKYGDGLKTLSSGTVSIDMLKTGDIRQLRCGEITINQLLGNYLDGMSQNLFLRIKKNGHYDVYPLMGQSSDSTVAWMDTQVVYSGQAGGVRYDLFLSLLENKWFYDAFLYNEGEEKTVDIIYSQDVGLAGLGHILANEAYNAQYIDHSTFKTEAGYTVCSRQNQQQPTGFPFLQQGGLGNIRSFSTDGYPFFGLSYKFTNEIESLQKPELDNRVYQYEFAYTALQSEEIQLSGQAQVTFYGLFKPSLPTSVAEPVSLDEVKQGRGNLRFEKTTDTEAPFLMKISLRDTFASQPLTDAELDSLYPLRRHEETEDGKLLSFFTETSAHVALPEKERYVERAHGHMILSGENDFVRDDQLASTSYIYGVFNSQIVVGNTNFHKLMSNCRNGLNAAKCSGQRIMVEINGRYRILTMPAVYEMGFNYAKWLYKLDDDMLEITAYSMLDRAILKLEVKSQKGRPYNFLMFSQMCSSPGEYDLPVTFERLDGDILFKHHPDAISAKSYPDMAFAMRVNRPFTLSDDRCFYPEMGSMGEPIMAIEILNTEQFQFTVEARIDGKPIQDSGRSFEEEAAAYRQWLHQGINGFNLSSPSSGYKADVDKFNDLALWYSHNARVHYASPHGLEQFGGAAWGTRDICQGPIEYFMATQNFDIVKDILIKIYSHQYMEDGSWPQWFMFDRYGWIQMHGSHGDVIVWPIKTVADYLMATGDTAILDTEIVYTTTDGYRFTETCETLYAHVKKAIGYIENNFYKGTKLSRYGEGDWDDTLQPANSALRDSMVSGWTVSLTFQAFKDLSKTLTAYDPDYAEHIGNLAKDIKADFHQYILKDGQVAGFIQFEEEAGGSGDIRYLLHPSDTKTGLTHRLLPMTRSMIAELFDPEEAAHHYDLIREKLYHPDGVRLMNTTCRYQGGVNTIFCRAETAANFGREIGLQYVHAHIRFIEAMAKTGKADEAWNGLLKINPILIQQAVPNATRRQSNCYFSSSDGAFDNRYEAMRDFDKLRTGDVPVKAGWRIYSSGSGIYLNQLITHVLGLRMQGNFAIIDPVLPKELDGMVFSYALAGKPVRIRYHIENSSGVTRITINGTEYAVTPCEEPYRKGGVMLPISVITSDCEIDVWS